MTEPSSGVPGEIADADVDAPTTDEPTTVKLDLDEEKLEAWDEVKGDYQIEPGGEPVPNSMDADAVASDEDAASRDADAASRDDAPGGESPQP